MRLARVRGDPLAGEALGFGERSLGSVDPNEPTPIRQTDLSVLSYDPSVAFDGFVQSAPVSDRGFPKGGTVVMGHNDRVPVSAVVNERESVGDRRLIGKLIKHTRPATRQVAVGVRRFAFRRGRIRNRRSGFAQALQPRCMRHHVVLDRD